MKLSIMKTLAVVFLFSFSCLYSQVSTQQFTPEERALLEWALTGKGSKPTISLPAQGTVTNGMFDADSSGSIYTEDAYMKNWYYPYEGPTSEILLNGALQKQRARDESEIERSNALASKWTQSGPSGMRVQGSSPTMYFAGRITSIAFHPVSGLHFTCGTGGLFGKPQFLSIYPLADKVPSLIGGAVAVHPSDPDIIFFGTGEYQRRNGIGLYKTTDGGESWYESPLVPKPNGIQKILIAPWDSTVMFAATSSGLFRSTDVGESWKQVGNFDCSDVAASSVGSVMLAGGFGKGVYRSSDYGVNWKLLTTDLPSKNIGRVSLCIAPSNINRAYVQISTDTNTILGVYRTDNLFFSTSPSWTNITPAISYMTRQGNIHNAITVHPSNYNIVWAGGIKLVRTTNGGTAWSEAGTNNQVHSDIKVLTYRPSDSLLYVGCDGGLFITSDEGATWNSQLNLLFPITQFYNIHVRYTDHRIKYGGSQDNGIAGTSTSTPSAWVYQTGGDGVDITTDWSDSNIVYSSDGVYNGALSWIRRKSTNQGTDWSSINTGISEDVPWAALYLEQDFTRPSYLYTNAGQYFYYTTNGGTNWLRMNSLALTGTAKHVSSNSTGTFVYGCTSTIPGSVVGFSWVGGMNPWTFATISTGLPSREVKRVAPSMSNADRAYAVVTGINHAQKIYKTTNRGTQWVNITGDLPDVAVNDVVENPYNGNILYLATQNGMFKSINGGTNWYQWNSGMPDAMWVFDLEYAFSDDGDYLVAGTFGRSTFERKATGFNAIFSVSDPILNFGTVNVGQSATDSFYVKNFGDTILTISAARSNHTDVVVSPSENVRISPGDSMLFSVTFTPILSRASKGRFEGSIDFFHDGDGSPSSMSLTGFVGDDFKFRSFMPESLITKKEVRRKTRTTSWRFDFANNAQPVDPASALYVQFTQPVTVFDSIAPFTQAVKKDRAGKIWEFTNGFVDYGSNTHINGQTKAKTIAVKNWRWVIGNETRDTLNDLHGALAATWISSGLEMPNTANLRKEIFEQMPYTMRNPLIIGNKEGNAKTLKVAYVSFASQNDIVTSLTPGKSLKQHDQYPRSFDYYNNGREMIGAVKKLTPDIQQNKLFAQLIALRVNIVASALGKTPAGFGELRYNDNASRYHGMTIKQIDSVANYYMTYSDSSFVGSGAEIDSIVTLINSAFTGPLDTATFHSGKLIFTGVKSIGEVPFLVRDTTLSSFVNSSGERITSRPDMFELYQNYPNPFNPTTLISFNIPEYAKVSLTVYNVLGQTVATPITNERYEAGFYEIEFDGADLPSGIYFYRLTGELLDEEGNLQNGETFTDTKKMLLLR